ncbi:MAG TPA: hypothetical protein VGK29_27030 [Paludibaculum sp.]|jgi:hypothetical protein
MVRLLLALLCALSLRADCVAWVQPPLGSACFPDHPGIYWTSRYPASLPITGLNLTMDPTLADAAFKTGLDSNGVQRFFFALPGEYVLELFLYFANSETDSWVLEVSEKPVDTRFAASPLRLGPSNRPRVVSLIGVVRGGDDITVRSNSPGYAVVGARWTARAAFENERVPQLLDRLRKLQADPFFENRLSSRAERMAELAELALRSRDPAAANEALLQLTRATYWIASENHQPRDNRRLVELFDEAAVRLPNHSAIRQMISAACAGTAPGLRGIPRGRWCDTIQPVPWVAPVDVRLEGAPAWAATQWQLRARLDAFTAWWVRRRQRANGELGGGWGDDVELLRHWGPLALGLGSEVAAEGIRRVADGVWNSGMLANGYARRISDVEHSSEPTTDTLPLIIALAPADPTAGARLAETAACAPFWILPQPDGQWRFRSSWFNCREHDPSPERALDVHLNTRALGPALWHAWLTRDPKLIELLAHYGDSWRKAQLDTSHGKPAGIFPPVLKSADGSYLIGSQQWDKPQAEWDYYQWSPASQESLTAFLRALQDLTGDPKWAQPVPSVTESIPPDQIPDHMAATAAKLETQYGTNFDLYTAEAIYTDRIAYALPANYTRYLFGGEAPRGDRAPEFHVTWPAAKARFARAVLAAGRQSLSARLYSFEAEPATASLRLWQLEKGNYQWECAGQRGAFAVQTPPVEITIPIPPSAEAELRITRRP